MKNCNHGLYKLNISLMCVIGLGFFVMMAASVKTVAEGMKEDKTHIHKWNLFTLNAYKLHQKLIKGRQVTTKTRIGGYSESKKFYKEVVFYDAKSGKRISTIQREIKNPKNIHWIEVLVRNKKGQVVRDYSSAYLVHYRNAPSQTLINLWGHTGNMHGFRQFDAGGDLIYEQCEGVWKGKKVMIRLFEDDLVNGGPSVAKTMKGGPYKACFTGVAQSAQKYLIPN